MPVLNASPGALANQLLAALPNEEFRKISASLEEVVLEAGEVLWEADEKGRYIYFPTTALVSMLYESETGVSAGIATIGHEGIAGAGVILGDVRTPDRAVVQNKGVAYRMKTASVNAEFHECGDFQSLIMGYAQALMTQISQNAICNRLHTVEQQFCRWLLVNYDHQQTHTFSMTQEQIAGVLGVRRETVSLAAALLQKRRLVRTSRGKIELLNIDRIHAAVCECYGIVKSEYDRILKNYANKHGA